MPLQSSITENFSHLKNMFPEDFCTFWPQFGVRIIEPTPVVPLVSFFEHFLFLPKMSKLRIKMQLTIHSLVLPKPWIFCQSQTLSKLRKCHYNPQLQRTSVFSKTCFQKISVHSDRSLASAVRSSSQRNFLFHFLTFFRFRPKKPIFGANWDT